jgi:hypothetical protein
MATKSDSSLSYYSFTSGSSADMSEMGSKDGVSPSTECLIQVRYSNGLTYYSWTGDGPFVGGQTSQGFFIQNVQTAVAVDGWKNGTRILTNGTANDRPLPNANLYLGAYNNNGTANRSSDRGCSFATMGNTIASGKEATFSTIVNNFQSQLGRYSY